jgi:N-sulfoglucosamine sulfohydrolase
MHVNPGERFRWDLDSQNNPRDVADMAGRARKFIEAAGGSPWFLQVGFADPHRAEAGFANRDYSGVMREKFDAAKVEVPPFLPDNAETRAEIAEYYEACSRLDAGIGMMMEALRSTGQLDRTLVIFVSDNGMPFPNAKTNLYDAGTRLPLIVRAPGETRRGSENDGFVSWTDITPSILEWTGARGPDYELHGRSFLGSAAPRDRVYFSHTFHELTMYYPTRGVRTSRYKYLLNLFPELSFPFSTDLWASATWQSVRAAKQQPRMVGVRRADGYLQRPAEELYDMAADPYEVRNLYNSSLHQEALATFRAEVQRFREQTRDPWLVNDNYK